MENAGQNSGLRPVNIITSTRMKSRFEEVSSVDSKLSSFLLVGELSPVSGFGGTVGYVKTTATYTLLH